MTPCGHPFSKQSFSNRSEAGSVLGQEAVLEGSSKTEYACQQTPGLEKPTSQLNIDVRSPHTLPRSPGKAEASISGPV